MFENGSSKICGRQPLKFLSNMVCWNKLYHFKFLNITSKVVVHKFYVVYSRTLCSKYWSGRGIIVFKYLSILGLLFLGHLSNSHFHEEEELTRSMTLQYFSWKKNKLKDKKYGKVCFEKLNKLSNWIFFHEIVKENCSFHLSTLASLTQNLQGSCRTWSIMGS